MVVDKEFDDIVFKKLDTDIYASNGEFSESGYSYTQVKIAMKEAYNLAIQNIADQCTGEPKEWTLKQKI